MSEFNEIGGINPKELGIDAGEATIPKEAEHKELNEAQRIKKDAYAEATRSAETVDEKGIVLPSMKNGLEMKGTGFGG